MCQSTLAKAFPSVETLVEQKQELVSYLLAKVKTEDWHAVADAAMDLREIEAQLELLNG